MAVYTANLFVVFATSYLADYFSFRGSSLNPDGKKKPLIWFVLFTILSLSLVSGLRFMVGTDYMNYAILYEDIQLDGLKVVQTQQMEIGYALLCALFGLVFDAPFAFFFFISALTQVLIILALRNYSRSFWLSCTLYVLIFAFFNTFNLVRQSLALSIVFYAHKHLVNKKMVSYFVAVLIASLFHTSVLVMIPVYFIVQRPAWSPIIFLGFLATFTALMLYDSVISVLFTALSDTRYSTYQGLMEEPTNGVNALRIGVAALPVLISLVFRKRLRTKIPHSNLVINMAAISLMITILAIKQVYFARLSLYFALYYVLLLPYFVELFEDRRLRVAIGTVFLVCYTAYCYVLMPKEGGILPYQTIAMAPYNWNILDYIFSR